MDIVTARDVEFLLFLVTNPRRRTGITLARREFIITTEIP